MTKPWRGNAGGDRRHDHGGDPRGRGVYPLDLRKREEVRPAFGERYPAYQIAHAVAEYYHAAGPCYVVPAACAAGNYAVAMAKQLLQEGYADILLVGGVDVFSAWRSPVFSVAFLSPPIAAVRLIGPGKGWCWEKDADFLFWRGKAKGSGKPLRPYPGAGLASNASHMTAPHKEGEGEWRSHA